MKHLSAVLLLSAVVMCLVNCPALSGDVAVETGEIDGAPFRIQVPPLWNRGLVVYAHGYLPRGVPWTPLNEIFTTVFLERRFALVESGYSRQGWAVEEGIRETEALRHYFVEKYGDPEVIFITGHSLGGLITLATIETYPDAYDGALPMCGPLVPAALFFRDSVFDMLVTFEALFGEALPQELRPLIEAAGLPEDAIAETLESDPALAETFSVHWGVRRDDLPGILSLYHLLYREVRDRAGGNPIDNRNTVYSGFGDADELNEAVPRYASDAESFAYLRNHYTPTGVLEDPVLAVHTTYDPGVPPHWPNTYHLTVSLTGHEEWFAQKWVEADGHCNIDPDLIARAFDELVEWVTKGTRPQPGLLSP